MLKQPFKCPICTHRLIKSKPRLSDCALTFLFSIQRYQCRSLNCWHGYLSISEPESEKSQSKHKARLQPPCTDKLKAQLAVKALAGESVYALSRQFHQDPRKIARWRWHVANNAAELFAPKLAQTVTPNEKALIYHLLGQIKRLKQELLNARKAQGVDT